jgi:carbohydrate-selective porin OprB
LEAMYTATVYRSVALMPDIQYIINPGGTSQTRDALSIGLQTNVTF